MKIKLKPHIICGYIATVLFCLMLLPQLYKSITTKSVDDISICFLFLMLFAAIFMLIYAYTIKAYPVLITNACNIIVSSTLIVVYFLYK